MFVKGIFKWLGIGGDLQRKVQPIGTSISEASSFRQIKLTTGYPLLVGWEGGGGIIFPFVVSNEVTLSKIIINLIWVFKKFLKKRTISAYPALHREKIHTKTGRHRASFI